MMLAALAAAITLNAATPVNVKSTFYADVAQKRYALAVRDGRSYADAHPEDLHFALDYAYALCSASQTARARTLLLRLAASPDAQVSAAARAQLAVLPPQPVEQRPAVSVYGYAEPDSRYADTFYGLQIRRDLSRGAIRPLLTLQLTGDTRSGPPETSPVFSTDTLFAGAGLHAPLAPGLDLRIAAGPGFGLRGQRSEGELRTELSFWRAFGAGGEHAQTSIGSTAFYYSRFAGNVMTYTSLTHTVPIARGMTALAGVNASTDTKGLSYNNYAEVFGGLEVRVDKNSAVRGEVRRGPGYTAVRAVLWFSQGP